MKSKNKSAKIKGTVFLNAMEHLEDEFFSCWAINAALGLTCSFFPEERTIYEDLFQLTTRRSIFTEDRCFDDEGERIIALQLAFEVLNGKTYKYLENSKKGGVV